jgi:hypothetical protein
MKKMLILMLILGVVSIASAMSLQISVGTNQQPADSTINLTAPSGTISLGIWSPDGWLSDADNLYFGLVCDPAKGTMTGGTVHAPPAPDGSFMIYDDLSPFFGNPGVYGQFMCYSDGGGPGTFVDGIEFHCEGLGDAVLSLILTDFSTYTTQDTLIIHQVVPEPATMLLLSLGGLFFRKFRK